MKLSKRQKLPFGSSRKCLADFTKWVHLAGSQFSQLLKLRVVFSAFTWNYLQRTRERGREKMSALCLGGKPCECMVMIWFLIDIYLAFKLFPLIGVHLCLLDGIFIRKTYWGKLIIHLGKNAGAFCDYNSINDSEAKSQLVLITWSFTDKTVHTYY